MNAEFNSILRVLLKKSVVCYHLITHSYSSIMAASLGKRSHDEMTSDYGNVEQTADPSNDSESNKPAIAEKRPRRQEVSESRPLEKAEIYFEDGLRKVKPYWFKYMTTVKRRWERKRLIEVLQNEFHGKNPDFFETAIRLGRFRVHGQMTSIDHVLDPLDIMTNIAHRHEVPILDRPLKILVNNDDVLVIDKPCSLPVHPCGRYFFNSLTQILKYDYGFKDLKLMHRLDRLTSGLVIIAKNTETDLKLKSEVVNRTIEKEYVCLVEGQFPEDAVECHKPIGVCFAKMGVQWILPDNDPKAKECLTKFELIRTNGSVSLVRCFPKTGRTHQIRVHLQYLGYPILNDYMYNNKVWGVNKGKGGIFEKPHEELCKDLATEFGAQNWVLSFDEALEKFRTHRQSLDLQSLSVEPIKEISEHLLEPNTSTVYDPYCIDCHVINRVPKESELQMYLHCLRYKGSDWEYATEMPDWARNMDA